jgi:putative endonuclease
VVSPVGEPSAITELFFVLLRAIIPLRRLRGLKLARGVPVSIGMAEDHRQSLGKLGENLACDALERRGYAIIARRYRTNLGEIDIVARDGETTVFVEVKSRAGDDFGGGAEAVTRWKQRKVTLMAMDYLARHRLEETPCRFDVVTVDVVDGTPPHVEVYPHAFESTY